MREPSITRFEADLAAALDGYAHAAPIAIDPAAVARTAIAATPAGRSPAAARTWSAARPALLLAALLALLIAMLVASGAVPLPSPASHARTRIMVSDGATVWVLGPAPDREQLATGPTIGRGFCPTLIGGTTTIAGQGYGAWAMSSLTGEPLPVIEADLDYAGGERWSPDRRKVAMMDLSGVVTIADLTDPAAVAETTIQVPGVQEVAWLPDSQRLVVVSDATDGRLSAALAEVLDGGGVAQSELGGWTVPAHEGLTLQTSPDGRQVLIQLFGPSRAEGTLVLGLEDRTLESLREWVDDVPGPIEQELGSTAVWDAAWSPDSREIAFGIAEPGRIVIVGPDGGRVLRSDQPAFDHPSQLRWSSGGLIAATTPTALFVFSDQDANLGPMWEGDPAGTFRAASAIDGPSIVAVVDAGGGQLGVHLVDGARGRPVSVAGLEAAPAPPGSHVCVDVQPLPD